MNSTSSATLDTKGFTRVLILQTSLSLHQSCSFRIIPTMNLFGGTMEQERNLYPIKLGKLLEYLSCTFDNYPFSEKKDSKYFGLLIDEFVDLDIEEELKQYYAWTLDLPERKKIYYRSRFRTWLKKAREFQKQEPIKVQWRGGRQHAQNRW